jgi:two-component system chemotaxis response regulator CheB
VHFSRPSIDRLFLSVASFYGAHAIGLLLSGTGYDGRDGIRAIKRGGGVTMVEDPATAEFSALPRVAVATGDVDFALPVESVGPMLVNLWQRRQ